MTVNIHTISAAICLIIGFTNCTHHSDQLEGVNRGLTNDSLIADGSFKDVSVDVELMYRFENDSFASELQSRFSDYFSYIANSKEASVFYDAESRAFYKHPEVSQSMALFYDGRFFSVHKPMIIAIYKSGQDTIAKLNFTRIDSAGIATSMATIDFGIKRENDQLYFSNMALINSRNWIERKVGSITYFYPQTHEFSEREAFKMEGFNKELASLFVMQPRKIRYFVCDTYIDAKKLQGFDYEYDMFNINVYGGSSDVGNRIIYSGNGSEYYPHELVHQYIPGWIGTNQINYWFLEGVCTFLGGSRGKDLDWHIDVLKKYIVDHDPDLSDVSKLPLMLDDTTVTAYVIGGLMCKLAYEKGGMDAVKDLMLSGNHDESFYEGINFVLGVDKMDFPSYLMDALEKY